MALGAIFIFALFALAGFVLVQTFMAGHPANGEDAGGDGGDGTDDGAGDDPVYVQTMSQQDLTQLGDPDSKASFLRSREYSNGDILRVIDVVERVEKEYAGEGGGISALRLWLESVMLEDPYAPALAIEGEDLPDIGEGDVIEYPVEVIVVDSVVEFMPRTGDIQKVIQ